MHNHRHWRHSCEAHSSNEKEFELNPWLAPKRVFVFALGPFRCCFLNNRRDLMELLITINIEMWSSATRNDPTERLRLSKINVSSAESTRNQLTILLTLIRREIEQSSNRWELERESQCEKWSLASLFIGRESLRLRAHPVSQRWSMPNLKTTSHQCDNYFNPTREWIEHVSLPAMLVRSQKRLKRATEMYFEQL